MCAAAASSPLASQAELARMLGVSRQAINDLIKRQIITMGADGRIDVELARVAIANRVRPSGKTAGNPPPTAAAEPPPDAAHPHDAALSYHVAKTLREAAEAKIAQLKLAQMQRVLIDADGAARAVTTAFRELRDGTMVIGHKLAATLATLSDASDIQAAIDTAVRDVFDSFALRTLPSLQQRIAAAEGETPQPEGSAP